MLNFIHKDESGHNCTLNNADKCAYCQIGFDINEKDPKKLKHYLLEITDKFEGGNNFLKFSVAYFYHTSINF